MAHFPAKKSKSSHHEKPRLVFFLGAGFSHSISEKIPVGRKLFAKVFEKVGMNSNEYKRLTDILRTIFPRHTLNDLSDGDQASQLFEIFLSVLEYAKNRETRGWLSFSQSDLVQIWDLVVAAVAAVLRYEHSGYGNYSRGKIGKLLGVISDCAERCENVSVITTNYDLIADKIVSRWHDKRLGYSNSPDPPTDLRRFQYGVCVRNIWRIQKNSSSRDDRYSEKWRRNRKLEIFKLHGSTNWAYCKKCRGLDLSLSRLEVREIFNRGLRPKCVEGCGTEYEWVIVPPVSDKNYGTYKLLIDVWEKAEQVLSEAHRVVFIGYAVSSIDSKVLNMLLRTRAECRQGNRNPWEYIVFDRDPDVLERFKTYFGSPEIQVDAAKFSISNFMRDYGDQVCTMPQ